MSCSRITFDRGPGPLVAVLVFVGAVAVVSNVGRRVAMGPDPPDHVEILWTAPLFWLLALGTWRALRYEGVTLAEVGLGRPQFVPGVVAFLAFWIGTSVVGVGYLTVTDATRAIGYHFAIPWYWLVAWLTLTLVSNGLVEELIFRGYVQSKCIALASQFERLPATAAGILLASTSFGVVHVPTALFVAGAPPGALPVIVLENGIFGIAFGLLYYVTQNVWFVGFFHGFANVWALPFPTDAVGAFTLVYLVVLVVVTAAYWYWARRADHLAVGVEKRVAE